MTNIACFLQYVAFAGLSAILSLFVRAHHLSTETESVVLGVDREKSVTGQGGETPGETPGQNRQRQQAGEGIELLDARS